MSKVYIVFFQDLRWYAFAAKVIQYFGFKEHHNKQNHVGLLIGNDFYDIKKSHKWKRQNWNRVVKKYKGSVRLKEIGEGINFTKQQMKEMRKYYYSIITAIASQEITSSIKDNKFTRFIDKVIDFIASFTAILMKFRGRPGFCDHVNLIAIDKLRLSNRIKLKKEIEEYIIRVKKNPGFDEITPANMFAELGYDIQVK